MDALARHLAFLNFEYSLLAVAGAGLVSHLVFKRFEPHDVLTLLLLLVVIPGALTTLLLPHYSGIDMALWTSFVTYLTTLVLSILAYRLSPWHPLAKYPGPIACKISKFWFAIISLGGKQHIYQRRLHDKYGDIVRVGPNELSIRSAAAIEPLMGSKGLPKGPFWDGRIPEHEKVKPLIALRDPREHARRRRPWSRAFSVAALKGYEIIVSQRSSQLVESLANHVGSVDLSKWIGYFSYDFMNDLAFGGGSEMMRHGDVDGLWHLLEAGQRNAIFMSHVPWLGQLSLRLPSLAKDLKAFRAHAQKRAMTRKKQGSAYRDLFHYLIDEDGIEPTPPSVIEVVSDGGLAIIAGADTASSAMSNLFYLLLANPVAYKRLQAEIDGLGDSAMDFAQQARMNYLNAAINESMRLFPPVLSGSQRAPEKGSGGQAVGEYFIPEGTSVFIPSYTVQRDLRNFAPLPDAFLPERWLSAEERMTLEPLIFKDEKLIHNTTAFLAFSYGPLICPGKNVAMQEMRMVVCSMMKTFDIRVEEGFRLESWEENLMDYFVTLKGKLPVVLTPRFV